MAGVPRKPAGGKPAGKPTRSALPEENDWAAERERLEQADAADAASAAGGADEQPEGGPTPKGPPSGASGIGSALPSLPKPTLKLPTRPTGGDLGGFLFGLGIYALFINYLHYGGLGVKGWLLAKFINSPLDPAAFADAPASSSIDTGPQAPLSQGA